MKRLLESKIAKGSTIYVASNNRIVKSCFDEITKNKYKSVNLEGSILVGIEQNVRRVK